MITYEDFDRVDIRVGVILDGVAALVAALWCGLVVPWVL